jgi:hypothetical protein
MRRSSRRSLAQLVVPLLVLAACEPESAQDGRPPPCAPGNALCATSGVCMALEKALDGASCAPWLNVRQGAVVTVPVPHVPPENVVGVSPLDGLQSAPTDIRSDGLDGSLVDVHAPHGIMPNDDAHVTIVTRVDGVVVPRDVRLIVSQIAVSSHGSNEGLGTRDQPFATLRHAAGVAGTGDTIVLKDGGNGLTQDNGDAVLIPGNVTLEGNGGTVPMPLTLAGSFAIRNATLLRRLVVTERATKVELFNFDGRAGITVDKKAMDTKLLIDGEPLDGGHPSSSASKTKIGSEGGLGPPIAVFGDGSYVSVTSAWLAPTVPTGIEAMLVTGQGQAIELHGAYIASSFGAQATLRFDGGDTILIDRTAIGGRVDVNASASRVTISGAQLIGSGTDGLRFLGASLSIDHTLFDNAPILINSPNGNIRIRSSHVVNYTGNALELVNGYVDLGTAVDAGANEFARGMTSRTVGSVTALFISALAGGNNAMSVSSTTFDGQPPKTMPCEVVGPQERSDDGVLQILYKVPVDFY